MITCGWQNEPFGSARRLSYKYTERHQELQFYIVCYNNKNNCFLVYMLELPPVAQYLDFELSGSTTKSINDI